MRLVAVGCAVVLAACPSPAPEPARPGPGPGTALPVVTPAVVPVDAPEASQEERLAAIQAAMNELDEAAQSCWAAAAAVRFDIEGDITAQIEIRPMGAVATLVKDGARNPTLAACLTALLGAYRWAPPLHGQTIQLPFRFRAPDGQSVIDRKLVPWNGQGKVSVAVLLDENNSNNGAASMFEIALANGGSTGPRIAERPELWYFLGPASVQVTGAGNRRAVAAGDMMYLPAHAARDVMTTGADVHAVIVMVPGGREGAARAGALPTRELGPIKSAVAGPVYLPASGAKTYPVLGGTVSIFAEATTIKDKLLAASLLALPANTVVPEHVHAGETELLYVLAGTGTLTAGGVAIAITQTSVVQIPPGIKHTFSATSELRALQIYTPGGPEQRFKAKAKP